jgi:GTP-binding protein YchF
MKIGIIGLPQTGKKTLFGLLVGRSALAGHADARQPVLGVAEVQDPRFDRLVEMYRPKKEVRARLEVVLLPKIEERAVSEGDIFKEMGEIDAFCHLVRAFEDDSVYHVWGKPDPGREVEFVHSELILHDLIFIEKRLERIDKQLKKIKDERQQKELALLSHFRDQLEQEQPLRLLELSDEEHAIITSYPLLSLRKLIIALNIADADIGKPERLEGLRGRFQKLGLWWVPIPVRTEAEIAQLDSAEERAEFMAEMGIKETALQALTRLCIEAVGLTSFFTVGKDEVRQWFVRRGAVVSRAAGVIHSDLERGFIRAEVMKYEELVAHGGEEQLKAAGKYYVKGKDYVVEDGDIINIRFNV